MIRELRISRCSIALASMLRNVYESRLDGGAVGLEKRVIGKFSVSTAAGTE
jgi:hypothetical protein